MMDPTQEKYLEEKCLLVDNQDNVVGEATKRQCHLVSENGDILLHRAFSVFLFNSKGELLIQKRSHTKITYPNKYTNSCCSHPLADIAEEIESKDIVGIKKAALRKLNHELGIEPDKLSLDDLIYVTRIHYKDSGDGTFGEHEIDYIIFIKKDLDVKPNPNEVSDAIYVSLNRFDQFLSEVGDDELTPWFKMIFKKKLLALWWKNLDYIDKYMDHKNILKLDMNDNL
ncbi:isopentenyl-diphosphate Delta-isomerase 1-like [Sitophilus oryzae]|uniref:isopentenyl-diphosphate Delta-isomerase n=1 Tax=Sitophilus oryzae TaxID=7048 RepID=A0A6J2XY73_SITOR|nr:isopentenyl-diphosphate Delta-isomerase 1-like [Sitophilus oryzae]XP_030755619.1 isopentenyl-diphosphate Delta-isomerase 1-like [Sitophilus oryzae]